MSEQHRNTPRHAQQTAGSVKRPVQGSAHRTASGSINRRPAVNKKKKKGLLSAFYKRNGQLDWTLIATLGAIIAIFILVILLIVYLIKGSGSSNDNTYGGGVPNISLITQAAATAAPAASQSAQNTQTVQTAQTVQQPLATPYVKPANETTTGRSATIRVAGDFVIHENVYNYAKKLAKQTNYTYDYNFAPMLNMVRGCLENADYTVTNVDGSVGGKKYYKYGYSSYPQFNTPEYILLALKDAGVDMLTMANNHMLDGWYDGLIAGIANVEKAGLAHVGANRSKEEKNSPVIIEINGIKVGMMNYTESLNSMESRGVDKKATEFGCNWVKNSDMAADAKILRNAGAEVIVCFMHWGTEYQLTPDSNQKAYAEKLVKAGVDVIIGGHPHVVQNATWLNGTNQFGETQRTLCLYSLGNFLSDQRAATKDGGIIFEFTLQETSSGKIEITQPGYIPTWVWRAGDETSGYTYSVVPVGQYLNSAPQGMSVADYTRMLESYNESITAMNKGIGTLLAE